MDKETQRNLVLAIVLSVAILFTFQALQPPPKKKPDGGTTAGGPKVPGKPGVSPGDPTRSPGTFLSREDRLKATEKERVKIETPAVSGSIWLKGARIDDLILKRYKETIKKDSPPVSLLQPVGSSNTFYTNHGWVDAKTNNRFAVKEGDKQKSLLDVTWKLASGTVLAPGQPITLTAELGGLKFERRFEIDQNYMITVTQKVTNTTAKPVSLAPAGWVYRRGLPQSEGFLILHEGPTIMHVAEKGGDGTKREPEYSDMRDGDIPPRQTWGGWLGFRDHYWMVVMVPDQSVQSSTFMAYDKNTQTYRIVYRHTKPVTVAAGESVTVTSRVFAGAKKYSALLDYRDRLGIPGFEWAIDFGRLWFITEPFMSTLIWLFGLVGNFGIAILILTVMVKIAFFWFSHRAYKSMNKMKALAPEMKKLRERYSDDKQKMNQELMALYKKEKVNPAAGCLPILIQIPVFFALYVTLFISLDMRHAPFFGWIQDLSAQDPTSILNLFGLLPWDAPKQGIVGLISIGIWPIIMGVTMWLQQKMNPPPTDPIQQKIFMILPFLFTFMLATFPAGLVIYWAWNNVLSVAQQWTIGRMQGTRGPKAKTKKNAPANVKDLAVVSDAPPPADDAPDEGEAPAPAPQKRGNMKRQPGEAPSKSRGRSSMSRGGRGGRGSGRGGKGRSRAKR